MPTSAQGYQYGHLASTNTWDAQQTLSAALNLPSGQIVFPATAVPSAGANTLDDYEEGDWTPVLTAEVPGDLVATLNIAVGKYLKIGRLVCATAHVNTSTFTHTTASGDALVTGLPFTSANISNLVAVGTISFNNITKAGYAVFASYIDANTAVVRVFAGGSGAGASKVAITNMPTGGEVQLRFTIWYQV